MVKLSAGCFPINSLRRSSKIGPNSLDPENSTKPCKPSASDLSVHFKNTQETSRITHDMHI